MSDPNRERDRKKSAHWTDPDTDILIRLLLQYKDSGRTADNGFKPEIWKRASEMVQGTTMIGGPKTPDACKSRWQRLQRDFKVVREMEALPGFTWNRRLHKLEASQECWDAAAKGQELHKYQKISLPWYDSLAILCPGDNPRARPRAPKPRTSLGQLSDSSMLSMSVSSGGQQPQTPGLDGSMSAQQGHPSGMLHPSNGHVGMGIAMADAALLGWDSSGDLDPDGDFERSFTLPDAHAFAMAHNQKRLGYDPSMMGAAPSNGVALPPRESPSKKARTTPMATGPQRQNSLPQPGQQAQQGSSAQHQHQQQQAQVQAQAQQHAGHSHSQPSQQSQANHSHHPHHQHHPQQNQQQQMHSQQQSQPPQQQQQQHHHQRPQHNAPPPHQQNHQQTHPQNLQYQLSLPQNPAGPSHSPDFTTSASSALQSLMASPSTSMPSIRSIPQQAPSQQQPHLSSSAPSAASRLQAQISEPMDSTSFKPYMPLPILPQHPPSAHPTPPTSTRHTPDSIAGLENSPLHRTHPHPLTPHTATWSEAQRRTEAIVQLQVQESDLSDEDLVEVMAEFEVNVAAADTYLAIHREGLRKKWLGRIVKMRRRV